MMKVARLAVGFILLLPLLVPSPPRDRLRMDRADIENDWFEEHALRRWPAQLRPEEDAFGAVDGRVTGQAGFQTAFEQNPWWQVDLGREFALGEIKIFNDCDRPYRNLRIAVHLSSDCTNFTEVYRHNGKMFRGFDDGKPLVVPLRGTPGRYVRIKTPAAMTLSLDEVQVYALGSKTNIALQRPAAQSSLSPASQRSPVLLASACTDQDVGIVTKRGRGLAHNLAESGVDVQDAVHQLDALGAAQNMAGSSDSARKSFLEARSIVRQLAWKNPLLDFEDILFIKQSSPIFPHMADQQFGWWSRPGGGIYLLEKFKTTNAAARLLTRALPPGSYNSLDLSFDADRVLFSYSQSEPGLATRAKMDKTKLPERSFYHLFELRLRDCAIKQLTRGRYDDFDARYLPNGDIIFLSTRRGTAIQCTPERTAQTVGNTFPNGYSRCGGSDLRPSGVFTLHAMDGDGGNLRPLSAFENCEWSPSLRADGRILYSRWDYVDRRNQDFVSLWSANQDGSNPQLVYGNYTIKPQIVLEAREIPNSSKIIFTASAHHSNRGGSLCLLDRSRGTEFEAPLTRLTPEVCFPETEGWPEHYYANPWPLSEQFFLVSWSCRRLPPAGASLPVPDELNPANAMGIYLYDVFGNLELLFRDPQLSCVYPVPVRRRAAPPVHQPSGDRAGPARGALLVQDVRHGLRNGDRITRLRVIGVPVKVQPEPNQPAIGVSKEDPGKFVLGTAPVESDGSAHFEVPSGVPLFFQALDTNGLVVQTMRSLTQVLPGQTLSCIGCHEHRDTTPAFGGRLLAALRPPSRLAPEPSGTWPLRFDILVQPVVEQRCAGCHNAHAARCLSAGLDLHGTNAWDALMSFGDNDLTRLSFERDQSVEGEGVAASSRLWRLLTSSSGHHDVKLTPPELARFATWMDTYSQKIGHFSPSQEQEVAAFRKKWDALTSPRELAGRDQPENQAKAVLGRSADFVAPTQ